jgi:hypothetical protein
MTEPLRSSRDDKRSLFNSSTSPFHALNFEPGTLNGEGLEIGFYDPAPRRQDRKEE